jgi:hypothetical protein
LKVVFRTETNSGLVMNATNKVYFYAFKVTNLEEDLSSNFYDITNGSIRALKNNTVRNITTNVTSIVNSTVNIS